MKQNGVLALDGKVKFWQLRMFSLSFNWCNANDQWLLEVFFLYLQRTPVDINDLESLGELGHGTCGHVVKMRHRSTGHLMAVKVSTLLFLYILCRTIIVLISNYYRLWLKNGQGKQPLRFLVPWPIQFMDPLLNHILILYSLATFCSFLVNHLKLQSKVALLFQCNSYWTDILANETVRE